jgi:type I restriction enzyme S subunit
MFTDLNPYPEHADSGVPWLGTLPTHWHVRRVKAVVRERVTKGHQNEPLLAATQSRGVIRKSDYGTRTVTATKDLDLLKLVEVGDFVISLRSFQGGIERAYDRGIISPAYTVLLPRETVQRDYLTLLFKSRPFIDGLTLCVTGIREGQNVDYVRLSRDWLPVPPADEQAAIVKYLGHANARIDRAVKAKRKMIALLEEQKQAIIKQIVTRGIDPTVPVKKSGISGLGDIPAHWETRKLKHLAVAVGGMTPSKERSDYWQGDVPWVSPKDMKIDIVCDSIDRVTQVALNETGLRLIKAGALVFVVRGMILARKIPVAITSVAVTINQDMKALIPIKGVDSQYLAVVLRGLQSELLQLISESGHGTKKLETSAWSNFQLPVPSLTEQLLVVERIKSRTATADDAITHAWHEVELLREFRTRLTADVVTGQLDIRDAAARLPELDPAVLVSGADPDDAADADLEGDLELTDVERARIDRGELQDGQ